MSTDYDPHVMHDNLKKRGYTHKEDGYHYMFRGTDDPIIVPDGDHGEWVAMGYTNKLVLNDGTTITDAKDFFCKKMEDTLTLKSEGHWSSSSDSDSSSSEDEFFSQESSEFVV